MISKDKILEIVKTYLHKSNTSFTRISDKVELEEKKLIPYGKYEDKLKDIYSVSYYVLGYQNDIMYALVLDASTGEILFGLSPSGFLDIEA